MPNINKFTQHLNSVGTTNKPNFHSVDTTNLPNLRSVGTTNLFTINRKCSSYYQVKRIDTKFVGDCT